MKIYIASSWKTAALANEIAKYLRKSGHEVDCFCDASTGRYVFHWTELVEKEDELKNYDAIDFLSDERTKKVFKVDKTWLDWADICLLILPAGRSAHLEAGYAKGQGKKLFIVGEFQKGEFDVMYGFADGLFRLEELNRLVEKLYRYEQDNV